MSFTSTSNEIFRHAIADYHINDNVDTPIKNPFPEDTINNILYHKCWIDTVQWHFEDIIRDPNIDPVAALVSSQEIAAEVTAGSASTFAGVGITPSSCTTMSLL